MVVLNKKKHPKIGVGIDLGTGNLAISIFEGGDSQVIQSPIDGPSMPTIVHYAEAKDKWHVGSDALLHSYGDTGDNVVMHVKRNLYERPYEKVFIGNKFNAIEITSKLLEHVRTLILAARPDLADYPQFGGDRKPADDLVIVFSVPADWSVEQTTAYGEAISAAGFHQIDGFVAEPVAAARHLAHLKQVDLNDGDRILTADAGAGTFDVTAMQYNRGIFDQISSANGDAYLAGHDFTNAIAIDIAKQLGVSWKQVFDKFGLNLRSVPPKVRPDIVNIWLAAEEAKKKLSLLDDVTVAVDNSRGRKTYTIDRDRARKLWRGLLAKLGDCLSKSLDNATADFSDIDHFLLVGGSAPLPGLREEIARVVGRDLSEIICCPDSASIIANGAAEHAYFQDDSAQALESGLVLRVFHTPSNADRNLLVIEPGQVLPADGFFIEHSGFLLRKTNGIGTLLVNSAVCRTAVRAKLTKGRDTFLEDSETIPLREVDVPLDTLPDGEHNVALGFTVDANRNPAMLIRPVDLDQVETLSVPLSLAKETGELRNRLNGALLIALIIDCSGSMHGEKFEKQKMGAKKFVEVALRKDASVSIVAFPAARWSAKAVLGTSELVSPFSTDCRELQSAIDSLSTNGGTPLTQALKKTQAVLSKNGQAASTIGVLFTDGQPNDIEAAEKAAVEFKKKHRLITVGIGKDVVKSFLISIATSRDDFFEAECPEDILNAFRAVSQLVFGDSNGRKPTSTRRDTGNQSDSSSTSHDDDWDSIDSMEV